MLQKIIETVVVHLLLYFTMPTTMSAALAVPSTAEKTVFLKKGDKYLVTSREGLDMLTRLPAGTYTIDQDPRDNSFFLQHIDPFEIDGKIYGETKPQADRILRTFLARKGSTGVLLAGEKGSGKTFLSKYISIQAAEQGIPTIVINQPLHGERFNAFIQAIQQPAIVLFDEFEKIYQPKDQQGQGGFRPHRMMSRRHRIMMGGDIMQDEYENVYQDSILTLLDGVYPSNMLFLMTVNDKKRVTKHLLNRPGRIYYILDFEGLSPAFIREYAQDTLKDASQLELLLSACSHFDAMNFDMLQAIIQEMNMYGESPQQVLKWLNARPEFGSLQEFQVQGLTVDDVPIKPISRTREWFGNPLGGSIFISYRKKRPPPKAMGGPGGGPTLSVSPRVMMHGMEGEDGDPVYDEHSHHMDGLTVDLEFTAKMMQTADGVTGVYTYYNPAKKATLQLQKKMN